MNLWIETASCNAIRARLRIARLRKLNHRISFVKVNKPKQLIGLNQKVRSRLFLSIVGIHRQKTAGVKVAVRVRDCGKSENQPVMGRIGIQNLFRPKGSRLEHGT